jgi:hypothetical protein
MPAISMYQASAPRFVNTLKNLATILDKAAAHADARKIDPAVLLQLRLFPDMLPLVRQVQIACDNAKGCVGRLAGVEIPRHEDTETRFDELQGRIQRVIDFIGTVSPEQLDGSEDRDIHLKLGPREVQFKGLQYLCGFALPNFYFHVTTAYDILRQGGVELKKSDFIGQP